MAEAVSLRDEIGAALDAGVTDDTATPSGGAPAPSGGDAAPAANDTGAAPAAPADAGANAASAAGKPDGRVRDEHGRFIKAAEAKPADVGGAGKGAEPAAQAAPAQGAAQPSDAQPEGVDLPPSTFTPAAKAAYAALPPDSPLRADIKKREADYQKGIGQYKQDAETGRRLMSAFRPEHLQTIQQEGSTPERAIASLLHTAHQLRVLGPQDKGRLIMQVAQQYGADLSQWMRPATAAGEGQPPAIDPHALTPVVQQLLQPVLQKVNQFETRFQTAEQQREAASAAEANASLESFRVAADEKGQPKHPYFEDVRGLMADFLERGYATDMETAYGMACRAHPEVSKTIASEQARRQDAQRLEEARRKAEDAKRASAVNATGQGGVGIAGATSNSLRSDLEAAYDTQVGARI